MSVVYILIAIVFGGALVNAAVEITRAHLRRSDTQAD
jgi:hypothetical protein